MTPVPVPSAGKGKVTFEEGTDPSSPSKAIIPGNRAKTLPLDSLRALP